MRAPVNLLNLFLKLTQKIKLIIKLIVKGGIDYVNDSDYVDSNRRAKKGFDVTNINKALPRVACNTAQLCESPVKLSEKSEFTL